MGYPKHPDTVIIKNEFYPKGLREIDVWNYYQSVKGKILREVVGRDLFFLIVPDAGRIIVKRAGKTTRFIRLTSSNYDEMITGRTVSVHSTMRRSEDLAIIDIDYDAFDKTLKKAVVDCFDFITTIPIVDSASIRFTGKTSFHVFCNLKKKFNVDTIRLLFKKFLTQSELANKYTVEYKRRSGIPNLDLAPNKFRGGFITLHSLSEIGLKCVEIPRSAVFSFTREKARI